MDVVETSVAESFSLKVEELPSTVLDATCRNFKGSLIGSSVDLFVDCLSEVAWEEEKC